MPDHRPRRGGAHRLRTPLLVRVARVGIALVVLVGGGGTLLVVGQSDPGPAVPVQGSFASVGDPYVIPAPPTAAAPPTTASPLQEAPAPALRTSSRSSDRVKSTRNRGARPESAPTTSSRSRERSTTAAATTAKTESAPRTTTDPPTSKAGTSSCSSDGITGGSVRWVGIAANYIADQTGFSGDMLGIANRAGNPDSDHPHGYAIDFMVDSKTEGDRVASFVRSNEAALGVTYVLWQVKDHFDHVHVSFRRQAPDLATFRC